MFEPGELVTQRDDGSHDEECRGVHGGFACGLRDRLQGRHLGALRGKGAGFNDRCGRVARLSQAQQGAANRREMGDPHVDDQGARESSQRRPVEPASPGVRRRVAVSGHKRHGRGRPAMGDGDTGVRRHTDSRGHTRHDFEGNAGCP